MKSIIIILFIYLPLSLLLSHNEESLPLPNYFFEAIREVETGGISDPSNAIGDNGKSLGPYQIQKPYWIDAVEFNPKLRNRPYEDVRDEKYARKIMLAYWNRYAPKAVKEKDYEKLARIHNGGCNIYKKKNTKAWHNTTSYWTKVKRKMEQKKNVIQN